MSLQYFLPIICTEVLFVILWHFQGCYNILQVIYQKKHISKVFIHFLKCLYTLEMLRPMSTLLVPTWEATCDSWTAQMEICHRPLFKSPLLLSTRLCLMLSHKKLCLFDSKDVVNHLHKVVEKKWDKLEPRALLCCSLEQQQQHTKNKRVSLLQKVDISSETSDWAGELSREDRQGT